MWTKKRFELGIPSDTVVLISVGDLNRNKNNEVVIEAIKEVPGVHYILCGDGPLREELEKKAESIRNRVHFLGYRTDIKELLVASHIFVMPSLREGLSRSLMEAMASGLPCIVSKIRGNVDLIEEGISGYLVNPKGVNQWAMRIKQVSSDREFMARLGINNLKRIASFSLLNVEKRISEVYLNTLDY